MKSLKLNGLLIAVIVCVLVLLCLQGFWLANLLRWKKTEFHKSIDLALEQTLVEERKQRTDSISNAIYHWLMDTSVTQITSKINPNYNSMVYQIADKYGKVHQNSSFSLSYESRPIKKGDSIVRKAVAAHIVNKFRESYQEYQSVLFYTQTIGDSASLLSETMRLDTLRLKRFYTERLNQSDIQTRFSFYFKTISDSLDKINKNQTASINNFRQTKRYKSDAYKNGETLYVIAIFEHPFKWLSIRLFAPLVLSFLVFAGISWILIYFYKIIRKQKLLADIKNDFIDNMTHELKTPISIISASAEAMEQFDVLKDESKTNKYISNIRNQSTQLHNIVSKVLEISLFENKEIRLEKTKVHVHALIEEIKADHLLLKACDTVHIETQSTDDLLWVDRFHFKNILYNLIDNCLKYKSGADAEIKISITEINQEKLILIKDNGKGIEPIYLSHIFDKFFRVPQGNIQEVKGFGLGLFYVKKILQLHGGDITAESIYGKGTSFCIRLPQQF